MGADGWEDVGPWRDEGNDSLLALQRVRFAERFDLSRFLADYLADARNALRSTQTGSDHPALKAHLIDLWSSAATSLAALLSAPLPTDWHEQLEIVRRVCGADGVGGILDVTSVGRDDYRSARVLSSAELADRLGTSRPTAADVRAGNRRLPDPGRGGCVCFPLFDATGQGVGWQFIGCEFD